MGIISVSRVAMGMAVDYNLTCDGVVNMQEGDTTVNIERNT